LVKNAQNQLAICYYLKSKFSAMTPSFNHKLWSTFSASNSNDESKYL